MSDLEKTNESELNTENTAEKPEKMGGFFTSHPRLANFCKAAAFVIIFLAILVPLTYMLRTTGDVKDRFEGFYYEPKDSLDIVMIGSSPTYSSCSSPMLYGQYGIKAYSLASNIQRPSAGVYLTKEAEKTQSPALYMYEMRMYASLEIGLQDNLAYTRGVTDNMKYSFNRIATINALIPDVADRYTYYFDIFKYHSNWTSLRLKSQLTSLTYTKNNQTKGSLITDKVGPADEPAIEESVTPAAIDQPQETALRNLLAYLKENNLNALFYLSPYQLAEGDQEKFEYIRQIIEEAGFEFLDMNQYYDEIGIDFATDFSDYGVHTNAAGQYKCTKFLGDYLTENYDLPDHRDEEDRSGWNEAYTKWQADYDAAMDTIAERIANEDWNDLGEDE